MQDASPIIPVPESPEEFVAWLNHPWPSEFNSTPKTTERIIARKKLEIEEGVLRDHFAEIIEIMNVRPEDVPSGYRPLEPRKGWLEKRSFLGDRMVNHILGGFPLYFQRRSGQTPPNKLEPGPTISGSQRREILIALAIVRLDERGLLRDIKRCSACKRWFESGDPRKRWCGDPCRKKHHKDEQTLRERRARIVSALPSRWNDLASKGYVRLRSGNCPGCERPVQWWRTPLRKTGRRGRPRVTMDIPLEGISGVDGLLVRHHVDHLKLEEFKREGDG